MARNKILYILTLILLGFYAFFYDEYVTAVIFFIILLLPVFLYFFLHYVSRKITISIDVHQKGLGNIGEQVPLQFVVKNESPFPISKVQLTLCYSNQFVENESKEVLCFPMEQNSSQRVTCNFTSDHCGSIKVRAKKVIIYDFLKLFSKRIPSDYLGNIFILPKINNNLNIKIMDNPFVNIETDEYSKTKSGDDSSEIFDVHEYKDGDKIHRIHWKLSSKRDVIMVKDYSLPLNCSILILVDLDVDSPKEDILSKLDVVMSYLLSLSRDLVQLEKQHYVSWYAKNKNDIVRCKVTSNEEVYKMMSQILSSPVTKNTKLILDYKNRYEVEEYSHIFCITNKEGDVLKQNIELLYPYSQYRIFKV